MLNLGFRRLLSDPSMFVRGSGKEMILALVYVDDILFSGAVSVVQSVVDKLSAEFILKTSEPLLQDGQSFKMLGRVITRLSSGFPLLVIVVLFVLQLFRWGWKGLSLSALLL